MEEDQDGHDLAGMQLGRTSALALSRGQQTLLPLGGKLLPEIIYGTKQFEYTHRWNLLVRNTTFLLCSILPGIAPYPELTLTKHEFVAVEFTPVTIS